MKKTCLTFILCIGGLLAVKAQTTKGNLFVGTSVESASYNSGNSNYLYPDGNINNQKTNDYSIDITQFIGGFLSDHFILGGRLGLDFTHNNTNNSVTEGGISSSNNTVSATRFDVGPFMRYYIFDEKPSKTLFYLQADGTIGTGGGSSYGSGLSSSSSYVSSGSLSGYFSYSGGASIGVTHFVTKNIGIDFSASYLYTHESFTDNTGASTAAVHSGFNGFSIGAGISLYL